MKIMHLLQSPHFSGAENVVCQIISMFEKDSDVEMIYCSQDGAIRAALEERNIPFYPLSDFSLSSVKKAIRDIKPDIIHAHDMRASFAASLFCGKAKLISHIHNNNFNSRGFSFKSIAYLYAGFRAKHIFWVSQSSFDGYAFHGLLKKKSEVLYNIIDIDKLYQKTEADHNSYNYDVIFLGRLTEQKNPLRLMNLLKKMIDKKSDIRIAVVGTGDLEANTKAEAKKLGIESNVHFWGYQTNPYKILKDAKVMVMTSLWEGTPMCVLEAMSLGVPVVSTPTDGIKAVVEDHKTGFLSNDDEELADCCISLIDNDDLHGNMSLFAMDRARKINDLDHYRRYIHIAYFS